MSGDEIFLFGFSRGAFTARSIAGLIDGVGLLTKAGLNYLAEVFKDFENRENPRYRPKYPNTPFPDKPSALDPNYKIQLQSVRKLIINFENKSLIRISAIYQDLIFPSRW
ncbi:hypothetical protein OEA41_010269 [Lepraria neglecta]|uniref:T6SS Phospholipase effector Tle1-like catalytic domain-containing protein n=1 Tax=Lepraria neglecta TaxID=209136 RepID=A0AAE0DHJ6_9LECA|nr:hypothetical protein OEA41_010269 [Lepraria neglecta]